MVLKTLLVSLFLSLGFTTGFLFSETYVFTPSWELRRWSQLTDEEKLRLLKKYPGTRLM